MFDERFCVRVQLKNSWISFLFHRTTWKGEGIRFLNQGQESGRSVWPPLWLYLSIWLLSFMHDFPAQLNWWFQYNFFRIKILSSRKQLLILIILPLSKNILKMNLSVINLSLARLLKVSSISHIANTGWNLCCHLLALMI